MVNGPPGTCTSAGSCTASGGGGPGGAAVSTAAPFLSWWVASMVSSCCCSCWATMPNAKPWLTSRDPLNAADPSTSSTRPRTSCA